MSAGGTRILDFEPIDQTLQVEGMPALEDGMLLSLLEVLPTHRALTIVRQLLRVDLQLLVAQFNPLPLVVLLLQDLMQLMNGYRKCTRLEDQLVAPLLLGSLLVRLIMTRVRMLAPQLTKIPLALGALNDPLARIERRGELLSAIVAPIRSAHLLRFHM
jgi:hypothetical protein